MADYVPPPVWNPPALVVRVEGPVHPKPRAIPAAPVVAARKTFQSGGYNASHTCPNCGRQQWVVESGRANVNGHTHRCPGCNTQWWH